MAFQRVGVLFVMLWAVPGLSVAHHSVDAQYDRNKQVSISGTVTKVEWTNPHGFIYLDVKEPSGELAKWEVELGSVSGLMRQGWTRNSLKPGDVIVVTGFATRDGTPLVCCGTTRLQDGRRVFQGATPDGLPAR